MNEAGSLVAAAARSMTEPLAGISQVRNAATGHQRFLSVAARHAEFLGGPGGRADADHPSRRLATTLMNLSTGGSYGDNEPAPSPWHRAGDALAVAHDVLATHVGPAGELRGPDTALLAHENQTGPALAELADIALVAVEASRPLALQVLQAALQFDDPGLERTAGRLIGGAREAAIGIASLCELLGDYPHGASALGELHPLPSRFAAVDSLDVALDRLRLDAFRQARGEQPANTLTLVTYADLAVIIADRAERLARVRLIASLPDGRVPHQAALDASHAAADAWRSISSKVRSTPCTARASLAARYVARDVWRYLDAQLDRKPNDENPPSVAAAVHGALSVIPELADSGSRVLDRLHWQRALLGPSEDRDRSIRPGAPTLMPFSFQQLTALHGLYDRAGALSCFAADQLSRGTTQSGALPVRRAARHQWPRSPPTTTYRPRPHPSPRR